MGGPGRWVSTIVMPAPTSVARAIGAGLRSGELLQDAAASLGRVLAGFALGIALALSLGLLMGMSALLHKLLNPVLQVLRPIPPIAYIPMAIVWFGIGNAPAIFLITIGAFFPTLLSTTTGVQHVDKIHILAARNLGQVAIHFSGGSYCQRPHRRYSMACGWVSARHSSW